MPRKFNLANLKSVREGNSRVARGPEVGGEKRTV